MKRLALLCTAIVAGYTGFSQISFTSTFQHGVSLPLDNKSANGTYDGTALHLGNNLDFNFGSGSFTWGLGAYLGHIHALGTNDSYKEAGLALARKYQLSTAQLQFNSTAFQSTQFLVGPIVGIHTGNLNLNLWAKGGYGLNEPGTYSVIYRENGLADQRIYATNKGDEKNGLAYNLGAGITYSFAPNIGMQLGVGYSGTRTSQINYSYDREKGVTPSFFTANNSFIQASVGLVFHFSGNSCADNGGFAQRGINTSRSNIKSPTRMEERHSVTSPRDAASGLATGRRMHKPITITKELDKVAGAEEIAIDEPGVQKNSIVSPRDPASGLPTGKRMHKPMVIRIESGDYDDATEIAIDEPGVQKNAIVSPRDVASGMPTGKRMHKPMVIRIEPGDNDGATEIAIDEQGVHITSPRDRASGMSTGKRMHKPIVITKELDRVAGEDGYDPWNGEDSEEGVVNNPLYQGSGHEGVNPLYQGKGIQEKGVKLNSEKGINEAGVQKTINTTRGNIKRINSITRNGNDAEIDCVMEENGKEYNVIIKGTMRRRVEVLKSN